MFEKIKKRLEDISNIGLEYSIRVTKDSCLPRENATFWVKEDSCQDCKSVSFENLNQLLGDFNCPDEIKNIQKQLHTKSRLQGLRVDFSKNNPTHCFYADHWNENKQNIEAYHWKDKRIVKKARYECVFLSSYDIIEKAVSIIHDEFKESFIDLCSPDLIKNCSCLIYQIHNEEIKEVYITYAWHPKLKTIFSYLPIAFQQQLSKTSYLACPLRHIGFSTIKDKEPEITVYFNADYRGSWPQNYTELREKVTKSSKQLLKEDESVLVTL